jgi:hypothetical protein
MFERAAADQQKSLVAFFYVAEHATWKTLEDLVARTRSGCA